MVNNSATAGSVGGKPDSTASTTSTGASVDEKTVPKDARVMISILKDMGISDFEPRVVNQLLEFSYRYVSTILEDSKVLSAHARKKAVDLDDVKLAVQMHTDHNLTNPPPRDLLLDVAAKRNAIPLPVPKQSGGLRLPPDRYCLTATNYRLKPNKKRGGGAKSHGVSGGQGGYGTNYGINSMSTIQQATKSQMKAGSKIAINSGSSSSVAPTFTINQLSNNKVMGNSTANSISSTPAAFIKINHPAGTASTPASSALTTVINQAPTTQLNTAAKIQIQPGGVAATGGAPIFSMTVNPPLVNSSATATTGAGVKRKADQLENHN